MNDIHEYFAESNVKGIFMRLQDYIPSKSAERTQHGTLAETVQTEHGPVNIYHEAGGVFYLENKKTARYTKVDVTKNSELGKLNVFLSYRLTLSSEDSQALEIEGWERLRDVCQGVRLNDGEFNEDELFFGPGIRPGMYD